MKNVYGVYNMKELRLHTLRGDIQTCGTDGMNKRGIRGLLQNRYVNLDTDITIDEFNNVLNEEYAKVEAWRERKAAKATATNGTVYDRNGKAVRVCVPGKD